MGGVARSAIARRIPSTRQGHLAGIVVAVLAEFRRARAAAQRYEDLRYRSACHSDVTPADISRLHLRGVLCPHQGCAAARLGIMTSAQPALAALAGPALWL